MNLWILILPVLASATVGSTRQTLCRRIERISGYIVDAQRHIESSRRAVELKQRLYVEMACRRFDLDTTGIEFGSSWAQKIHHDMNEENYSLSYLALPQSTQRLHCMVLKNSIESHSTKIDRRMTSLAHLEKLKPEYENVLAIFDRGERIEPKWNRVLEMAEKYERYERGVRAISIQLHDFLKSKTVRENTGEMFWAPQNTKTVLQDLVDTIMREEDDAEKLRICLEMVLQSQTMTRWNLHVLVKEFLDTYKLQMTAIGTDLLNAERDNLSRVV